MSWLLILGGFFGVLAVCAFLADNILWRIPAFNKLMKWIEGGK